ncbi:MAG TPA: pyridoxal 5'-phosphate synthase glutaminase subunit PdxT [Firmicutes bacterium]|uniref:pyridoxal 5'-phosphate synthase glutaminase subunit PdxT n=1 Tax=Gelria sp. Kuro-4 TaxID=2796927 RepID=UPI0019C2332E|nr:pyridoxal 5'-phosphate synthase glutaminase subunit PdxT [Gelria sp. Kuro-4]BCV23758.1 pyridoxal 5'-phosphate synthase subunit PdxT [Gelria sp. Kuro-4]HHV56734.1 pyridoxal 5'-phosphate synthase glutaminase subunit PdxT [Bacillota bacterium]
MGPVGVLALQGAFREHRAALERLGVPVREVRLPADLNGLSGLILPGGESTAMGRLLREFGLREPLCRLGKEGLPMWGTCAGMILLAERIVGEDTVHLGLMDIAVRRNAYGGQLDSFRTELTIPAVSPAPFPLVFIRAPYVEEAGPQACVLAMLNGKIVAVQQRNLLATAFHPELTDDLRFHRYFLHAIERYHH